jgi:hypothetical protein
MRRIANTTRHLRAKTLLGVVSFAIALLLGCGRGELPRKVISGSVTCGGHKVALGMVRFAPLDAGNSLPSASGRIVDGRYRIDGQGGAPLGKYRVEIDARRGNGQKKTNPLSGKITEETVTVGPRVYAGAQSPLVAEVKADGDGRIDLAIP